MDIRVCAVKRWVLLHLTAFILLHPCSAQPALIRMSSSEGDAAQEANETAMGEPAAAPIWEMDETWWAEYNGWRYFYVHNETQISIARAEAEAARHDGGGAKARGVSSTLPSILGSGTFPDFPPSEDGCKYSGADRDLSFDGRLSIWDEAIFVTHDEGALVLFDRIGSIQVLAVDSCADGRVLSLGFDNLEFCSQRWVKPEKPDILIRDNPDPLTRSFKVLVKITASSDLPILGDGVYFPATGKMHLVGCTRMKHQLYDSSNRANDFAVSTAELMNISFNVPTAAPTTNISGSEELMARMAPFLSELEGRTHPLNASTPDDCAISVIVQYPPLNCRWNTDRFLKYSVRSKREKDDPLYFKPVERRAFFPYLRRSYEAGRGSDNLETQLRLEIGGRIILLALGLVCLALQIEHGRHNEEALPFVSLVMLGIQLANHLSQTSIFKDLQVGPYRSFWSGFQRHISGTGKEYPGDRLGNGDWISEYAALGLSEHVPYQAMATAAIFMYVWVFHKVGDRRRIMKLRVLRKRAGAKDPPSDWRVMYATVAFFSVLCFLGFFAIGADRYGHIRWALTETNISHSGDAVYSAWEPSVAEESRFVSWRFYELSQAHWSFVNKLTGLVVSFFLVPQLLGNMHWELQGRPLSKWFYVGIPFLQSLPHFFSIAKHFQLLPIFPSYDPYLNSTYGVYENPITWWQFGVVLCSTLQVLAVHSQFSRSLIHGSRHSTPNTAGVQSCDLL